MILLSCQKLCFTLLSFLSLPFSEKITSDPIVGDLCAMFSEVQWCRVKVLNITDGKISVYFVDHGETIVTTKDELRPLPSQFTKLPFQVQIVFLNNFFISFC